MKAKVKVANKAVAPSAMIGEPDALSINFSFVDPDEAIKAGFRRNTSITMTIESEEGYAMHSEHIIEIKPV